MPASGKRFQRRRGRNFLRIPLQDEGGHPDSARRLKHLHDDDLVLYHYGEIRTAPAEGHLRICRGCRDRLRSMPFDPSALTPPPADFQKPTRAERKVHPPLGRTVGFLHRFLRRLASTGAGRRRPI